MKNYPSGISGVYSGYGGALGIMDIIPERKIKITW